MSDDESLKANIKYVADPQPYLWKIGMTKDKLGLVEVGDDYELEGRGPAEVTADIGTKAVIMGLQLMGLSDMERQVILELTFRLVGSEEDDGA